MTVGADGPMARVTYLPGVVPLSESELPRITEPEAPAERLERAVRVRPSGRRDTATTGIKATAGSETKAGPGTGERAHRVSLHGLTRRNLSRWELEKLLRSRDLDENAIAAELARLEQAGLIDDQALAETVVRTRHERKGLSRSALAAELRTRHIDQEYIAAALSSLDGDDERVKATELALKRAPQLHSLDRQTAVRRLSGYLQRKGYSSDVVRFAVDEALHGTERTVRFD